jgi:hypothetical protein
MHDIRLGVFMDEGAPAVIEDSLAWIAARSADPTAEAAQETKRESVWYLNLKIKRKKWTKKQISDDDYNKQWEENDIIDGISNKISDIRNTWHRIKSRSSTFAVSYFTLKSLKAPQVRIPIASGGYIRVIKTFQRPFPSL